MQADQDSRAPVPVGVETHAGLLGQRQRNSAALCIGLARRAGKGQRACEALAWEFARTWHADRVKAFESGHSAHCAQIWPADSSPIVTFGNRRSYGIFEFA